MPESFVRARKAFGEPSFQAGKPVPAPDPSSWTRI
jgi:hypothetical protein